MEEHPHDHFILRELGAVDDKFCSVTTLKMNSSWVWSSLESNNKSSSIIPACFWVSFDGSSRRRIVVLVRFAVSGGLRVRRYGSA